MNRWARKMLIGLLVFALQHSVFGESTYVVVDQAIGETDMMAEGVGRQFKKSLLLQGVERVDVVVLPAEPTQVIALKQDEVRVLDFSHVSDIVASPNAMCSQLVELFRTLPFGSTIFKIGREDAAWNEMCVIGEIDEYLNEIPVREYEDGESLGSDLVS